MDRKGEDFMALQEYVRAKATLLERLANMEEKRDKIKKVIKIGDDGSLPPSITPLNSPVNATLGLTWLGNNWFAGAGIRGGTVVGASDSQAAYVKDRPISTADVCATIYHCLGIDPDMPVHDRANRPVAVALGGQPIHEVLA